MKLYKFLRLVDGQIKSDHGNCVWKIGEWKKENKAEACNSGFHCSAEPLDALYYVNGEVLAEVEVNGKSDIKYDKQAWSEMRIVKAYEWNKRDSVELDVFSAELVVKIYVDWAEKNKVDSKPITDDIEAAKKWIKDHRKNKDAAADAAADAANAAAYAATYGARAATYGARAATIKKINAYMKKQIKTLKLIK